MQRILIARLSAMGDIVHSLPAVAALRRALPQATIGWAIEERWVDLLAAKSAARKTKFNSFIVSFLSKRFARRTNAAGKPQKC